jgi:hypothetical protein
MLRFYRERNLPHPYDVLMQNSMNRQAVFTWTAEGGCPYVEA